MLKKTVGFICKLDKPFLLNSINEPLGGAETWIIQMAIQFAKNDYHVVIFNRNSYYMLYNNSIEICPIETLDNKTSYQYFEHMFIMRFFDTDILDILKKNNCCSNIYYVLHDIWLWNSYKFDETARTSMDDINKDEWYKSHIKKIFVMSDWHKNINLATLSSEIIAINGNGLTLPEEENDGERDNAIFWSSCYNRGLDILVEKIAPFVLKEIPDFKIYTSTYDTEGQINNYTNLDYVVDLGSFNKQDLYKEMQKHKVWFYPCSHWETFCISVLENILNDVDIITHNKYGLSTTLKYFDNVFVEDGDYNDEKYCEYIANIIIDKIKNYNDADRKTIRKIMKNYISNEYSWSAMFTKIHNDIKQYEKDNSNNS